ncbi:MAG TPA: amino acid adenylation domain-containing protein, partial [Pseudolysinimonas sp.]|nr:amino acid adenylation domain-containing protein [Pseudolysinimonas sp.]
MRCTPEAPAVVEGDRELSYAALDRAANRLAHRLLAHGVRPGDCVATRLERGVGLVVAELAILKAGGAYVPLDPQAPAARQAWMVADAAARLVLAEAADPAAAGPGCQVLWLERTAEDAAVASSPGLMLSSEAPAYVMYTSGSTGTPKGVVVPHRAVNRLVRDNGYAEFFATDRVAWVGSPAFDISTLEVWAPLLHGACLVIVSRAEVLEAPALRAVVEAQRVSVLHLTSGLFRNVVDVLGEVLAGLRLLLVGGDVVDPAAVGRTLRQHRPDALLHCYGPTEGTTFATTYAVSEVADRAARLPIGRPIANTRIYVLDSYGEPVPLGAVGELHVGGAGVALGYLHRPALTAERFVCDPFSGEPGARMYRTGDLARYLPDGNLELLGRNDQQVKVRGYRIELGEIEARLCAHPAVRESVVIAREDTAGDKRLVAYVTCAPAPAGDSDSDVDVPAAELVAALRRHLAEQLPEYMVPAAFVQLAALPLTPNGKLDRQALPAPGGEAVLARAYEAPRGELEETLATVWTELLGVPRVGRHDHFFELGGHSLLAVTLLERLRRLGLGTEIRTLFAAPTLSALAATLGSHRDVAVPPNAIRPDSATITPAQLPLIALTQGDIDRIVAGVPGGVANIQDIYALSPLQEGILFHHLLARQGDPYILTGQMAFPERALLDRYLGAVQAVVARHDILRTAFVWEGQSAPAQVVWRQARLSVTEVELPAAGAAGREELARRFDPRRHRMDLTAAPLLRFVIAREPGSERWQVLQLQHHLIGDHSAMEILHGEVEAILCGRGHELAAPQPFRNLVAQARLGLGAAEHERFFRDLLGDIDEPTTPFGLREVHRDGGDVGEARRMLPASLNDRLRAQARRLGVSLASLCHLAFGQVVARASGREQVVFGTVLFGRMHGGPGADRAMGLFINTLPVRLDLDATAVEDSVRHTHALLAELMRHEHASLALAQRCSGVAAPAPLFTSLLNYRYSGGTTRSPEAGRPWEGVRGIRAQERTNYPV